MMSGKYKRLVRIAHDLFVCALDRLQHSPSLWLHWLRTSGGYDWPANLRDHTSEFDVACQYNAGVIFRKTHHEPHKIFNLERFENNHILHFSHEPECIKSLKVQLGPRRNWLCPSQCHDTYFSVRSTRPCGHCGLKGGCVLSRPDHVQPWY